MLRIKFAPIIFTLPFLIQLSFAYAQERSTKNDRLFLTSGDQKEGKVTAVEEETIQFTHIGESLPYTIKKSLIHKIEFASGRVEVLNERNSLTQEKSNFKEKTIAILPLNYAEVGSERAYPDMKFHLQKIVYKFLKEHNKEYKYQDPSETNALLLKNGINDLKIRKYTMPELATLLGVEYVITGAVTQRSNGQISFTNGKTDTSVEIENEENNTNQKIKANANSEFTSTTSTMTSMISYVDISVYQINGDKIFDQSKRALFQTENAYKSALHFLLKRIPLYGK